jgi:hypothetical protein
MLAYPAPYLPGCDSTSRDEVTSRPASSIPLLSAAGQRSQVMEDPQFKAEFENAQAYLRELDAAFIEITNPLELYTFEAYAAMELDTNQWNTFRTH